MRILQHGRGHPWAPPWGSAEALQVDQAIREGVAAVDLQRRCCNRFLEGRCLDREDLRLDALGTDPGGVKAEGGGGGHGALPLVPENSTAWGAGVNLPREDQKRTAQFGSVRQLTQAHQVPLLLTQNRSLPLRCSTTTTGSPAIWFARRFFALLLIGVRVTVMVIGSVAVERILSGHGAVTEHLLPQVDDAFGLAWSRCPLQGAGNAQAGDRVFGVGIVVAAVGEAHVLVGGADADASLHGRRCGVLWNCRRSAAGVTTPCRVCLAECFGGLLLVDVDRGVCTVQRNGAQQHGKGGKGGGEDVAHGWGGVGREGRGAVAPRRDQNSRLAMLWRTSPYSPTMLPAASRM